MIAGRLHWRPPGAKLQGRNILAGFDFPNGSLVFTEAGTKRRASLHVGNAYSDEILHAARLSPIALTHKLQPQEWDRLHTATRSTLELWITRLQAEAQTGFPEKVTAFRKDMAVHGRYEEPCPKCGEKIMRIRYADNETNYCAHCQTGGKVLADRSLSRLLGSHWPRTLDELEALKRR
jgi:formamidopyrimidine-DNA glycosylase